MIEELSQHETPDTIEIPDFLPMPSHTIQRVPATIMKFDNDRDRWELVTLLPTPKQQAGHTSWKTKPFEVQDDWLRGHVVTLGCGALAARV